MNLRLKRTHYGPTGIFGELSIDAPTAPAASTPAHTLEHAYQDDLGDYGPKLPPGTYTCQRGMHRLAHSPAPFETFMILGVPSFRGQAVSGILFHAGNVNSDSEGCILLGEQTTPSFSAIVNSLEAFGAFLVLQHGVDSFQLTVVA